MNLKQIEAEAAAKIHLCVCDLIRAENEAFNDYLIQRGHSWTIDEDFPCEWVCPICESPMVFNLGLFDAEYREQHMRAFYLLEQAWQSEEFADDAANRAEYESLCDYCEKRHGEVLGAMFGADYYGAKAAAKRAYNQLSGWV